jgi:rhodanese-related sulfurtransferase
VTLLPICGGKRIQGPDVKEVKRILSEFLAVAALALIIGLTANAASPKGLRLTKNYFLKPVLPPVDTRPTDTRPREPGPTTLPTQPATGPAEELTEDQIIQNLRNAGFNAIYHHEVVEIYESPYYRDGLYMIVDARSERLYPEGHIPGAYHLYSFYADQYIDTVMKAYNLAEGLQAEKIVVYCNGGKCEDSEFTVRDLLAKGIPPHKVFIYGLGFGGWKDKGMPYETGDRNSGQIKQEPPKHTAPATQEAKK